MCDIDFNGIPGRIKAMRDKKAWKQQELADNAGLSRKTIIDWENEYPSRCNLQTLLPICKALDCDLDYILGINKLPTKLRQAIHDATGLSEEAIEALMQVKPYYNTDSTAFSMIELINAIITGPWESLGICAGEYEFIANHADTHSTDNITYTDGKHLDRQMLQSYIFQELLKALVANLKWDRTQYYDPYHPEKNVTPPPTPKPIEPTPPQKRRKPRKGGKDNGDNQEKG
ncbi:MAG: helix-turn-helix transcriptional regulator [Lachnospiraceae bacterium]|jgi:DNA-binding XRE family transcriptional regulator|nr:helix-turn-helix transcriptional regulator [Lachnospiraceae bacterium]